MKKAEGEEEEGKPDPLTQLVTTFCRGAMTERSGALQVIYLSNNNYRQYEIIVIYILISRKIRCICLML